MSNITHNELTEILRLHELWLGGREGGQRANLRWADLRWADLRWADLQRADLRWANLRWADLQRADLRWANLQRANLEGANLQRADLRWADLQRANLRWADLTGAIGFIRAGQDERGYTFDATIDDKNVIVITAGCRRFIGMAAARTHWQAAHDDEPILKADCLSLVDRIEAMATARGWKLEPDATQGGSDDNSDPA